MKTALRLLKLTIQAWRKDRASLMAAGLAFYTLVSLAPLLILLLSAAGSFFGPEEVEDSLVRGTRAILGNDAAQLLQTIVGNAPLREAQLLATLVGLGVVIYGSTKVFTELQRALQIIWLGRDEARRIPWPLGVLKTHLFSFLMVIGVGLLWLIGVVSSTAISIIGAWMSDATSAGLRLASLIQVVASISLLTLSFGLIYRFLPGGRVRWRDVWLGAAITAVLITVGQKLIALYLGYTSISSLYGAAGSLVVVVLWFYYSWLTFFLGAEFTKVYATSRE